MDKADKTKAARWRGYGINVLLFVAIVLAVRAWQQRDMVSGTAPILQGLTLSGERCILPTRPVRPLLVHFWASWCPVCRAEQGSIDAIGRDHQVITVAMQSGSAQEVARYLREQGVDLTVVNDADGSISGAWGVHAVPASFVIGTDGQIRFVEVGYTTEIGLRLRLWLAGLG